LISTLKIVLTRDNSHTLIHADFNEHYHSTFGAIQESEHVFIDAGLNFARNKNNYLEVLEIGFGTGLNALLTYLWSTNNCIKINYTGIEAYPITSSIAASLNFAERLNMDKKDFVKMHHEKIKLISLSEKFKLIKIIDKVENIELNDSQFDVVFFDAFSPDKQPELWTENIFRKIANSMKIGGVLTTYSTKGIVKRALKSVGLTIEKLPGPHGKREILRALKT